METDQRLLRHLAVAVLLKLALLAVLWWAWVRDARVDVDAGAMADRVGAPPRHTGENK
ncbi:cytochrome oxidase putative small subunit CydP [Duganella vulcania]|uniref:cytochrome oxidase putative small subunit CydP n=1 Tax=Duganella vulcania TaxID=2692166 RepID=UPI001581DA0A|nr:cytochrome oxidase putative small subunit CydP [Duganella vulcania]